MCVATLVAAGFAEIPYLEEAAASLVLGVLLALYFSHAAGVPGLLEHGGHCGWGWCNPTPFGWIFIAAVALSILWLVAWGLAAVSTRLFRGRNASQSIDR